MTEIVAWSDSKEELHKPLSKEELMIIGGEVLSVAQRPDLDSVAQEHVINTGKENPNAVNPGVFIGNPEIGVPTNSDNAYRSVDRRGIKDLAEVGVVRGAYTATGGERSSTKTDRTYWSTGTEGKTHGFASPGHMIIETPRDAPESGWVTADKVSAIYAQDQAGTVHDILKP